MVRNISFRGTGLDQVIANISGRFYRLILSRMEISIYRKWNNKIDNIIERNDGPTTRCGLFKYAKSGSRK